MVCLGNICRSPLAHGILEHKLQQKKLNWTVNSCGTSSWHIGEPPDRRSIEIARMNGIDISQQRAAQFSKEDYKNYDLIIAMDASNYNDIISQAQNESDKAKVSMLMNYLYKGENRQVPDPYYNGGFQLVFDMISEATDKLIKNYEK